MKFLRKELFMWFQSIFPHLKITKGKHDFILENLGRHHLTQVIKVNLASNGMNFQNILPDKKKGKELSVASVMFLPIIHNLNLIKRIIRQIPAQTEGHSAK